MQRIFGRPTAKAAALIKSREDFNLAIRSNDQKMLLGQGENGEDDDNANWARNMGAIPLGGGNCPTNKFAGFSDYLDAGTKKVWASARAADLVANVILSTETKLNWRDPSSRAAKKPIKPNAELLRLLQNPNPYDTISEMLYLWVHHMKHVGNAVWFKDEMNGYGQPKNVYWLMPQHLTIVPDSKTRIRCYKYRVNQTEITFAPEEIIHFKRPNPMDANWGIGEIESGSTLYDEFINRALYNERFMQNGAMPSSVLVKDDQDVDPDQWKKLKAKFAEEYAGVKNSGKTAWLNGKWDLLTLGLDAKAMQELERSKQNITEIFLNHGVPLSVAGYGSANYATARQEDMSFRKYTCLPLLNIFTDVMNSPRGFVTSFTQEHKLDFSLAGLIDVEQVMKDFGPLWDRGGVTPNDLRELAGLPRKDDPLLDAHYMSASYVPIEIAGVTAPTEAELAGSPATPVTGKPKPSVQGEVNTGNNTPGGKQSSKAAEPIVLEIRQPQQNSGSVMIRRVPEGFVAQKFA